MTEYRTKPIVPEVAIEPAATPDHSIDTTPKTDPPKENIYDVDDIVGYFDVKDFGKLLLEPQLDVHSIKDKVDFINRFLISRGDEMNIKDLKTSRVNMLKKIEQNLKVGKDHKYHHRIEKVFNMLQTIKKIEDEKMRLQELTARVNQKYGEGFAR